MGDALVPVAHPVPAIVDPAAAFGRPIVVPALVVDVGPRAAKRFANFFGSIANDNTRAAYQRACQNFFAWCDASGLDELAAIEPIHVGAYVKSMAGKFEKPTIKQHLAAIRMLFDYLVVGQILAINPAHAVRGPKHSVKRGKTPVLSAAQARQLLDSIDTSTVVGLRDRADDLQLRPRRRGGRHARRGLLRRRQALAAAPQRKRRQGPRDAGASQSRSLSRRLHACGQPIRSEGDSP